MKTQISTTPEQSQRLIACGVNPDSADMVWQESLTLYGKRRNEIFLLIRDDDHEFRTTDTPAWSLSALLDLLPTEIKIDGYTYRISIYFENHDEPVIGNQWCLYYKPKKHNEKSRIDDVTMYSTDLIQCSVLMIEWLTSNGYTLNTK